MSSQIVKPVRSHYAGFTLIELSIVLVIIGLIIGGVLAGADLIRASEIRSIVKDKESFEAAIYAFKGKYNCYPGDCINAETYFGTDSSGCPYGGGATGTCNGNGNGAIDYSNESFRVWQQLGLASLIKGSYTGIPGDVSSYTYAVINQNIPSSKISNVGYQIGYFYYSGDVNPIFAIAGTTLSNRLLVGRQRVSPNINNAGFLSPTEVYLMDLKYDDGRPLTGIITVLHYGIVNESISGTCATIGASATDPTTVYAGGSQKVCNAVFNIHF